MTKESPVSQGPEIDLSNIPLEDLVSIHNQVLRKIATQAKVGLEDSLAAGHDSHGSNHSNNKITDRTLQEQIARLQRGPLQGPGQG
jgi:hypothetical protein